jgi:hypothetical protein
MKNPFYDLLEYSPGRLSSSFLMAAARAFIKRTGVWVPFGRQLKHCLALSQERI